MDYSVVFISSFGFGVSVLWVAVVLVVSGVGLSIGRYVEVRLSGGLRLLRER